jgi:hypothetical protein
MKIKAFLTHVVNDRQDNDSAVKLDFKIEYPHTVAYLTIEPEQPLAGHIPLSDAVTGALKELHQALTHVLQTPSALNVQSPIHLGKIRN